MNTYKMIFAAVLFLASSTLAIAQSNFDCDSILILWKEKKFEDLRTGFGQLATKASLTAKETAALAFRDYIFLGDLSGAKVKLELVLQKYENSSTQFPADYRYWLDTALFEVNTEIKIHARRGRTSDQLKAKASPTIIRDKWGNDYHPIIDLILQTPSIPTQ